MTAGRPAALELRELRKSLYCKSKESFTIKQRPTSRRRQTCSPHNTLMHCSYVHTDRPTGIQVRRSQAHRQTDRWVTNSYVKR